METPMYIVCARADVYVMGGTFGLVAGHSKSTSNIYVLSRYVLMYTKIAEKKVGKYVL